MARRPDFGSEEKIWSRKELDEIAQNLSHLSLTGVREFYERAYATVALRAGISRLREQSKSWSRPGSN